jgi:pyridoxamine 5'-phosphate oxidase
MSEARLGPFLNDFTDAAGCYARVAWRLGTAARASEHPLRLFTLATVGPDRYPYARAVILRGFDPEDRAVRFYTDCRSSKVRHIAAEPRVALLFYDHHSRLQFRVPAVARLHHEDEEARQGWLDSPPEHRALYAAESGPGTGLDPDAPVGFPPPPDEDDADAFSRFVVVVCHFDSLDVTELRPDGHRRVRLTWGPYGLDINRLAP